MNTKFRKILLVLLGTAFVCFSCFSQTVFARAGGGGGNGGGGSGGSSGGSSGSHAGKVNGNHGNNSNGSSSDITDFPGGGDGVVQVLLFGVLVFVTGGGSTVALVWRTHKAKKKAIRLLKEYEKIGVHWDYREIQNCVEKAYFVIQESWKRYDPSYAAEYLSQDLTQKWNTKLQWVKIRNEEIVQKHVKLLGADPVKVHDDVGEEKDSIWYLIHGKMVGYYRDRDTKEVVRGNPRAEDFYEYWLFVCRDGKWVLDEILQEEEWKEDK